MGLASFAFVIEVEHPIEYPVCREVDLSLLTIICCVTHHVFQRHIMSDPLQPHLFRATSTGT